MDKYDFTEFYIICGPIMRERIEEFKVHNLEMYAKFKNDLNFNEDHAENQTQLLLKLSDVEFKNIYNESTIIDDECISMNQYKSAPNYKYIYNSYLSNINVLQKCIDISITPISNILTFFRHADLNLECCKLLMTVIIDKIDILLLAYYNNNFECMQYVINNMTKSDLVKFLTKCRPIFNVINILIMDRIYNINDNDLKSQLDNLFKYINLHSIENTLIECYYIIKYMSRADGISQKQYKYTMYQSDLNIFDNEKCIKNLKDHNDVYNTLLEFHFRPRGTLTKCPKN
jgi:hypothetical protein